jgi:hypothetical protein
MGMLSIKPALIAFMSLRPNMPMDIHHMQRGLFLIEVGLYGDPTSIPTGYAFRPGSYGPVSHDVYGAAMELSVEGRIATLNNHEVATYIPLERGYAEGLAILSSLSSVRRYGFIETATWVQNCSIEELAESFRQHYPEFCSFGLEETEHGAFQEKETED